jgi:hypothetical protein
MVKKVGPFLNILINPNPRLVTRRTTRSSIISYAIESGVQLNERGHQGGLNGAKKLRKMGVLVELKKYETFPFQTHQWLVGMGTRLELKNSNGSDPINSNGSVPNSN